MVEAYRSQYGSGLHQRDADQPVRQRRQLSSRIEPRRRRPDPPLPRGEDFRAPIASWSGAPGTPRREFLYVDDMRGCLHAFDEDLFRATELVNIGTGEDITIAEFARVVAATVGYSGGLLRRLAAGRHPAQAARRQPAGQGSAGAPRPRSRTASGSPIRPISTRQ